MRSPATLLGNYGPASSSSVINYIPSTATTYAEAPSTDFYGTLRKTNNFVDAGAVEFVATPGPAVANVTGGPLSFGNVVTGSTSAAQTLTLHNTGGATLTGITLAFAPTQYSRPAGAAGGTCGATLASAASCTINVVFSPTATGLVNGTLTIGGSVAVTGSPVALSGTGVAAATVSLAPNPLTITVATPIGNIGTGTGTVTLTNTSATASVTVTNVTVTGGSGALGWMFTNGVLAGPDNCTGVTVAPLGTCTVAVRFTNTSAAVGVNRTGAITFTDNGAGSPQSGVLIGHANP